MLTFLEFAFLMNLGKFIDKSFYKEKDVLSPIFVKACYGRNPAEACVVDYQLETLVCDRGKVMRW